MAPTKYLVVLTVTFSLQFIFVYSSLEQIHVLFRHGARTPGKDNMYPKDPYLNDTWYPYGLGSLTNKGKLSLFKLGEELRSKYNAFLGEIYQEPDLYARSTSYPRTKMSLEVLLAGLYPPSKDQQWGPLDWQPVPFNFVQYESDKLLGFPIYYCQDLIDEYQKVSHSEEALQYLKDHLVDIQYVNSATGLNASSTLDLLTLYMGLKAEEQELVLPDWTKGVYEGFLKDAANLEYKIQTGSSLLVKATGGPLLKKILEDIEANGPKVFLYAAHEYNVAYVLAALKSFVPHVPEFSSSIVFEVHKEDGDFAIKVLYTENGSEKVLILPGCEEMCDLGRFKEIVAEFIPERDWCW